MSNHMFRDSQTQLGENLLRAYLNFLKFFKCLKCCVRKLDVYDSFVSAGGKMRRERVLSVHQRRHDVSAPYHIPTVRLKVPACRNQSHWLLSTRILPTEVRSGSTSLPNRGRTCTISLNTRWQHVPGPKQSPQNCTLLATQYY